MRYKLFTLFFALITSVEFSYAFTVVDGINYDFNETDKTAIVHRRASYSGDVVIPDSVRFNYVYYRVIGIYKQAFHNCTGLTSITIPNSVLEIGDEAFAGCGDLASVSMGSGVKTIGKGAFDGCAFTSFIIPNGIKCIEESTFNFCSNMTSITIPNSVISIGDYAFQGCNSLTSFTLPNSVTNIGRDAFLYVPVPIYNNIFFAHLPEDYSGSYCIPEGIKQLVFAFSHCVDLTSVTIPNSVVYIGENSFYDCRTLTSIIIPNSVDSIGKFAFYGCTSLTSITCKAVNPPSLDSYVFNRVDKSIPLYVPTESVAAYQTADQWEDFMNIQGVDTEGIDQITNTQLPIKNKVFHNGQLLIICDGKVYNVTGLQVK